MAAQWITIADYTRRYGVSDMTARRRIRAGKLRAIIKDGKYYIEVDPTGAPPHADETQHNTTQHTAPHQGAYTQPQAVGSGIDTTPQLQRIESALERIETALAAITAQLTSPPAEAQPHEEPGTIAKLQRQIEELESLNRALEDAQPTPL